MTYLPEDPAERREFDRAVTIYGDPLRAMAATLSVWAQMAPEDGSYGKLLAIFANEAMKAAPRSSGELTPEVKP